MEKIVVYLCYYYHNKKTVCEEEKCFLSLHVSKFYSQILVMLATMVILTWNFKAYI